MRKIKVGLIQQYYRRYTNEFNESCRRKVLRLGMLLIAHTVDYTSRIT